MRNERFPVHRTLTFTACALLVLGAALPAQAQHHEHHHDVAMPTSGVRADLVRDLEFVEQRYLALAEVMAPHYAWRPSEGVRSTSEVLMHVAAANFLIPSLIGMDLPEGMDRESLQAMERVTDPADVRRALEHSFQHARHVIARTSDDALDEPASLFGMETTKRGALLLLVSHTHEHLGQSIAYARSNAVVPPWNAER